MSDTLLQDQAARQAILEELDTSILVEAGAGSGKTHNLVGRMVALVREGRCRVETLAAVTFTRKAASELKGRFQLTLEQERSREGDPLRRQRLDQALLDLDRCFVGTVHSFCACLLRERPIEAGIDPDFQELDDMEDSLLKGRGWQENLLRVETKAPDELDALRQIDLRPTDLVDYYQALTAYPEVEVVTGARPRPDFSPMRAALEQLLTLAARLLPDQTPPKGWDQLQQLLRQVIRWQHNFGFTDDLVVARLLGRLDKKGDITQNRWRQRDDAKEAKAAFLEFQEQVLQPFLREWREHRHQCCTAFVTPALERYQRLRRESAKLNYQDLLLTTASLLQGHPEVRCYFQERYTHLLVDEFQDTDPVQAEILFYLTGKPVEEQDWRRLVPRPGSLFVVGDPKQSIYRFRRADIDIYNEVKRLLAASGGRVLELTTNFRSLDTVGDWLNTTFRELLPAEATSYQAAFTRLDTVRSTAEEQLSGVRVIRLPRVEYHRQDEIVRIDAGEIAAWIRQALDGGLSLSRTSEELEVGLTECPRPADFLVLLRNKARIDAYAHALEQQGIPCQIAGGGGFSSSMEVAELVTLCQFLIDPDNQVLLVAVLRGLWFGFSDQLLWLFRQAGGRLLIDKPLPDQLDSDQLEQLEQAFQQLRTFQKWVHTLPASTALHRVVRELGALPYALTGQLGLSRAACLEQCLEFLAAAERRGITTFTGVVHYLELLVDSQVEAEISIYPGADDAVRLMNLHKAKGLEAPVVLLANPAKRGNYPPSFHIERCGKRPQGYFLIQRQQEYYTEVIGQPADWEAMAEEELHYLEAEELRLLYVAATRAKNLLVVSCYPEQQETRHWQQLQPFLEDALQLEHTRASVRCDTAGLFLPERDLSRFALLKARDGFLSAESAVNQLSYQVTAVTELVREQGEQPAYRATGRGRSWGRVVHRLLEQLAREGLLPSEPLLRQLLAEEGRDQRELAQLLDLVAGVLSSPFWQRVQAVAERLAEVPFTMKQDDGRIITGVIDLALHTGEGWVLVDYKTDSVQNDQEVAHLAHYYAPQLQLYRECWERLAGNRVVETGLYFTDLQRWVVVA